MFRRFVLLFIVISMVVETWTSFTGKRDAVSVWLMSPCFVIQKKEKKKGEKKKDDCSCCISHSRSE